MIDLVALGLNDKGVDPDLELTHRFMLDAFAGFGLDKLHQRLWQSEPIGGASPDVWGRYCEMERVRDTVKSAA